MAPWTDYPGCLRAQMLNAAAARRDRRSLTPEGSNRAIRTHDGATMTGTADAREGKRTPMKRMGMVTPAPSRSESTSTRRRIARSGRRCWPRSQRSEHPQLLDLSARAGEPPVRLSSSTTARITRPTCSRMAADPRNSPLVGLDGAAPAAARNPGRRGMVGQDGRSVLRRVNHPRRVHVARPERGRSAHRDHRDLRERLARLIVMAPSAAISRALIRRRPRLLDRCPRQ